MASLSIRLRLTIWYAAVLLLGLGLFGGAMWLALEHRLMAAVDNALAQRVDGIRTVIEIEGPIHTPEQVQLELREFSREVPDGSLIEIRDASGAPVLAPDRSFSAAVRGVQGYQTLPRDGRAYRLLASRIEYAGKSYDTLVASPLDEVRTVMADFRMLLLMMIPGVLAAACAGGYWISRRALAPVDEITRVAKSISVQNLSERLPAPRTGDELQRMSETWNEVLERLDTAVKRIRRFTSDASHELRTPVALIRATAELALRRERDPEHYRKALRDIQIEAEHMTELTESLLTLARADAHGLEMPLAPVDLNGVVAEVAHRSQAVAEPKSIRLSARLNPRPALVSANAGGIRRLLLILIDNAIKYTPPGGTVVVSTYEREGGFMLAVEDSGEGIDPDALPHIFERFYRADQSRGETAGVGLGLSIAQLIAHAHQTEIGVESAPGAGACFHLVLRGAG